VTGRGAYTTAAWEHLPLCQQQGKIVYKIMGKAKAKTKSAAKSAKGAAHPSHAKSGSVAGTRGSAANAATAGSGNGDDSGGKGMRTRGSGANRAPVESVLGRGLQHVGLRGGSLRATRASPAAAAAAAAATSIPRVVTEPHVFTGNAETAARGHLARQGVCVGKLVSATRQRMLNVQSGVGGVLQPHSSSTAANTTASSSGSSSTVNQRKRGGGGVCVELLQVLSAEELVGLRRDQAERNGTVVDVTGSPPTPPYPPSPLS
jgi:hypothetical protein